MSETRNQRITLRLTRDQLLRLKAFALKFNVAPAELAFIAVEDHINQWGEPPSIYYEWRHRDDRGDEVERPTIPRRAPLGGEGQAERGEGVPEPSGDAPNHP